MSEVPSLSYDRIVRAFQRGGWIVVRQRGSHIRSQKRVGGQVLKSTIPAHRPVKRTTLAKLLKETHTELRDFLDWL